MEDTTDRGRTPTDSELKVLAEVIDWEVRGRSETRAFRGHEIDDLKQALWLKLLSAYPTFDPSRAQLKTFMTTVAANAASDHLKAARRCRQRERGHAEFEDSLYVGVSAKEGTNQDANHDIAVTLQECEGTHGDVVKIVAGGRSVSEAARELGVTPSNARYCLGKFGKELYPEGWPRESK